MDGPRGPATSQAPTIGCGASSAGVASWADVWRTDVATARPSPPAPRPASAVRRERDGVVCDAVMGLLLVESCSDSSIPSKGGVGDRACALSPPGTSVSDAYLGRRIVSTYTE